MSTFVLIHGAGGSAWDWHLVEPELRARGHDVVAVDLPCEDENAGLSERADAVVDAIGDRRDLVVVAHSYGGFTGMLVCDRLDVDLLVLLTGMIPAPGEAPGDWWSHTGYDEVDAPEDEVALFLHDVPPALAAEALARSRNESNAAYDQPWPLSAHPDVPTKFLLCRDDRFFPPQFMRRVVRERLGITPDEIDGSHCVYLSRPAELAERLDSYVTSAGSPRRTARR